MCLLADRERASPDEVRFTAGRVRGNGKLQEAPPDWGVSAK